MTATDAAAPTIMDRLREETRELHSAAEGHPFQRSLVEGTVSREQYARWLGQMLLIHRALEAGLRDLCARHSGAARVVREEQFQEPYLREDLAVLGVGVEAVLPTRATHEVVMRIAREHAAEPIALLGRHYVLEGSNNGNRFIARAVSKGLGIAPGGPGLRYLDPYGDCQRALWQQFKDDMLASTFTPAEQDRMVAAAKDMFEAIGAVSDDLVPSSAR